MQNRCMQSELTNKWSKILIIKNKQYSLGHRLRAVPHFSSGIVERAKRELALLSLRKNGGLLVVYLGQKENNFGQIALTKKTC